MMKMNDLQNVRSSVPTIILKRQVVFFTCILAKHIN